MEQEIDFVVTWVDGGDPAWRRERARFSGETGVDDDECRYRDWGLLRYWFRGVEKFAPWVRRVHFITWGHLPPWLNTECPKLRIVRHEDYIPREYLPTFNCNVLEIHLHRIKGLAEQFVYFNDDLYLLRSVGPDCFFSEGLPWDMLAFQPVVANPENPVMSHLFLNNSLVLCRHFRKRENVKHQPGNYFHLGYPPLYFFYNLLELAFPKYTGFYTVHGPAPFLRKTFLELWEKEEAVLTATSGHRFRNQDDVTDYLFRDWQKLSGNFRPRNVQRDLSYFGLGENHEGLLRTIRGQKSRMLCINDAAEVPDADRIQREIQEAFEQILPEASAFER